MSRFRKMLEDLNNVSFEGASKSDLSYRDEYRKLIETVVLDVCIKQIRKKNDIRQLLAYLSS